MLDKQQSFLPLIVNQYYFIKTKKPVICVIYSFIELQIIAIFILDFLNNFATTNLVYFIKTRSNEVINRICY